MSSCGSHPVPRIRYRRGSIPSDPNFKSLELIPKSYEPRDILLEVQEFSRDPDHIQNIYKGEFVRIFKRWIAITTPDPFVSGEFGEFQLEEDLQSAMEALDAFFFAGCLTRPRQCAMFEKPLTDLKVQRNIFREGQAGHQAYLGTDLILGLAATDAVGWTAIYIDTLNNGAPRTVESMFETLVHEMAHAIFLTFVCDGEHCQSMAANSWVLGQHGHGNIWVQMAELMRRTIQLWDFDLASFYNTNDIRWHNMERN